jgi:hypothetical protein
MDRHSTNRRVSQGRPRASVFDGYLDGTPLKILKQRSDEKLADPGHGLRAEEAAVVSFLAHQLEDTTGAKVVTTATRR